MSGVPSPYGAQCVHPTPTTSTLVRTEGLGGFNPVEVYTCDECGTESRVRLMHEAEDTGWAPEGDDD